MINVLHDHIKLCCSFDLFLHLGPAPPNIPTFLSSTSTSITLRLNPADEGPVQRTYNVKVSETSSDNRLVSSEKTNQTLITVTNLYESTQYIISVITSNEAGRSLSSPDAYYWTGIENKHCVGKQVHWFNLIR